MLPAPAKAAPAGDAWLHELKYDGCRTQILVEDGRARAFDRSGEDCSNRYAPLLDAAAALGASCAILDGEVIVQDAQGRSDFAALEVAVSRHPERLVFMAFDLLHVDGRDLLAAPVEERRARLQALIGDNDPGFAIQFSAHVEGGGAEFLAAVERMGLAGIVSKKRGSRYRSGLSPDWLQVQTLARRERLEPSAPRPIPGTAKGPAGEPSYTKPKLPEKRALLAYYEQVAPLLLEHAGGRILNLFRCTGGYCFFQRNRNHPDAGGVFAPPIRFVPVAQKNGRTEEYLYVDSPEGVLACVQADAVEFHGWGSRAADAERPDRIVLDLDPGEGTGFDAVKAGAFRMRELLDAIGLASFPMLSGGKGVHVVLPVAPEQEWPDVREFTRRICAALAEAEPHRYTVALPKAERKGRIFLDYLRNQRTATAILPYSLRARGGAPVAAPVSWDELGALDSARAFTIAEAPLLLRRAKSRALKGWGIAAQRLPKLA
ncbi:MAG TPA: non-homologous end-joining DNA ligase [Allosphingosinicella sp.]|jgi:DNA ligase D-like protein (predicted polymerase)